MALMFGVFSVALVFLFLRKDSSQEPVVVARTQKPPTRGHVPGEVTRASELTIGSLVYVPEGALVAVSGKVYLFVETEDSSPYHVVLRLDDLVVNGRRVNGPVSSGRYRVVWVSAPPGRAQYEIDLQFVPAADSQALVG